MGLLPVDLLYQVGAAIQDAAWLEGRPIVVLASGDLSHRLTPDAPAGFNPEGEVFDRELMRLVRQADIDGILNIDQSQREAAGECGYRTLVMMLGAFDESQVTSEVLSYEGPFGVGYGVAVLTPSAR
jgi:AmmeMemoRadiSam system protein B